MRFFCEVCLKGPDTGRPIFSASGIANTSVPLLHRSLIKHLMQGRVSAKTSFWRHLDTSIEMGKINVKATIVILPSEYPKNQLKCDNIHTICSP